MQTSGQRGGKTAARVLAGWACLEPPLAAVGGAAVSSAGHRHRINGSTWTESNAGKATRRARRGLPAEKALAGVPLGTLGTHSSMNRELGTAKHLLVHVPLHRCLTLRMRVCKTRPRRDPGLLE